MDTSSARMTDQINSSELAFITLDDQGLIQKCSSTCEQVLGYPPTELLGQHVSLLVPKLEGVELVQQGRVNSRLGYLCHCAIPFLTRRNDGNWFASLLFFNLLNEGKSGLRMIVRNIGELGRSPGCPITI